MTHPAALLKAHGLRAGKKRGQNYLIQPATAGAIAASAGAGPGDSVVEIGAGLGALTLPLAQSAAKVWAVEVDRGIHAALLEVLAEAGADNVEPLLADALNLDWPDLAARAGGPVVVAGNLPYAISSPLLFTLLDNLACWKRATLMVQKELAERLLSAPGVKDWGRMSVLVQTWCAVRRGMEVGPGQFFPRPAVASQVVHLEPLERPAADLDSPQARENYAKVVKAAFSQRRKMMGNSLAGGLRRERGPVVEALERAGVEPTRRAETLSVAEFAAVTKELEPL
ncbi:16S rRNA (adenine(1518)-N(6)/adenine(1519)-N(6))-dimethyltransferase RsmA [Desulfoferula mesophila]|uniref:Ribosomal RNA small subunit methyltransferase A n=1 Tax=Desulfoferula mesophila TaxID=3058419 RepID=A0AAU9EW94_9BACT|nr:ribosomal RNA small subunit methyltransferase A [Desulfoferula mesophilus]